MIKYFDFEKPIENIDEKIKILNNGDLEVNKKKFKNTAQKKINNLKKYIVI